MATGDINDFLTRLLGLLPQQWFGNGSTPNLNAILTGYASAGNFLYNQTAYLKLQTRIKTATDTFLDLISADFFGNTLPRGAGENDASFRNRILSNLPPLKATRTAMVQVLTNLTGRTPKLFEPRRPADTGGYSSGGAGYGVAGGWGSLQIPFQGLVDAYRPLGNGIPGVAGYNTGAGGYSTASYFVYISQSQTTNQVTDAQIYAAADATKVAGTQVWLRISS